MPGPDVLSALLDELATMPASSRRAILAALTPEERDMLGSRPVVARETELGATAGPSPLSPWLAIRVDALRDGSLDPTLPSVTPAARQALLRSLDGTGPAPKVAATSAPGKSLFDSFGGKLAARMGRP